MPAATKMQRRKAQPSSRLSGKNTPLTQPNASANIGSFTRVSKAISVPAKDLDAKPTTAAVTTVEVKSSAATTPSSRKRKTAATSDDESTPTQERASKRISSVSKPVAPAPTSRRAVRSTRTVSTSASSTPTQPISSPPKPAAAASQRKRGRSPSPASDFESDKSTIDTGALFKRLRLEASPGPATPPLTPDASGISDTENTPDILPDEALGLIDLQSALLRTLTLHYAHNGPNTPADLQRLLPDVARAWRRRKVSKVEVQTCIGVLAASKGRQPFLLIDYGRNKICIELDQAYTTAMYDEREFNARFYDNLSALWRKFCSDDENASGKLFLESLPRASITVSESFTKAAPIFAKGQQRLDDLKQGITAKKLEKEVQQQAADSPMANSDGTKMSLLDRIRQKALQKAQAPAGLTPAQLERRAALQRAAEVAALLAMLSRATANGSGGRMPFTMTAMLEKLKDTFRMGISREEGAACVRLLGKEIAPEWIRVVVVAGRENVVIDTNRTLGKADIERRVQQLL